MNASLWDIIFIILIAIIIYIIISIRRKSNYAKIKELERKTFTKLDKIDFGVNIKVSQNDRTSNKETYSIIKTIKVPVEKYVYFKGTANFNFSSIISDFYHDTNSNVEFSEIHSVYDVEIFNIEEIDKSQFNNLLLFNHKLTFNQLNVTVKKNESNYAVNAQDVNFLMNKKPLHVQVEGDEVFGTINNDVTFWLKKTIFIDQEIEFILTSLDEPTIPVIPAATETNVEPEILKDEGNKVLDEVLNTVEKNTRVVVISENKYKAETNFIRIIILFLLLSALLFILAPWFLFFILLFLMPIGLVYLFSSLKSKFPILFRKFSYFLFFLLFFASFVWVCSLVYAIMTTPQKNKLEQIYNKDKDQDNEKKSITIHPIRIENTGHDSIAKTQIIYDTIIYHHRIWYSKNIEYEGDISVKSSSYWEVENYRLSNFSAYDFKSEYTRLTLFDDKKLDLVYKMLDSIKKNNDLSTSSFAHLIVNMVQDIPYAYVLPNSCLSVANSYSMESSFNDSKCIGYIPLGVQSPVQFSYNLLGDCDTRTLFLYTVMKHYNYDVCILNSMIYKHSILGIVLPDEPAYNFFFIDNKKYLPWETTDKGFDPGVLPYEISNKTYWYKEI
jgi:hypothetical protein